MPRGSTHEQKRSTRPNSLRPKEPERLIYRYESVQFEEKYKSVRHVLPTGPAKVLDIGAGTGVDASWLADKGHRVLAVEPTAAFRDAGMRLHPSERMNGSMTAFPG